MIQGLENIRIAVDAARAADIDDHARLLVLHAEIRRRSAHQSEWRSVMHCQHGIPLLISHLDNKKKLEVSPAPRNPSGKRKFSLRK